MARESPFFFFFCFILSLCECVTVNLFSFCIFPSDELSFDFVRSYYAIFRRIYLILYIGCSCICILTILYLCNKCDTLSNNVAQYGITLNLCIMNLYIFSSRTWILSCAGINTNICTRKNNKYTDK